MNSTTLGYIGNCKDATTLLMKTITNIQRSVSAQSDFSKVCTNVTGSLITVATSMQALLADLRTSIDSLHTPKLYLSHGKQYMCSK